MVQQLFVHFAIESKVKQLTYAAYIDKSSLAHSNITQHQYCLVDCQQQVNDMTVPLALSPTQLSWSLLYLKLSNLAVGDILNIKEDESLNNYHCCYTFKCPDTE